MHRPRASTVAAVMCLVSCGFLWAQTPPQTGLTRTQTPAHDQQVPWTQPAQGHAGPEVFQIGMVDNSAVASIARTLTGPNLAYLGAALGRAALYRSYILDLLDRYRMPVELLYLPLIESGYLPRAVSRSGAVGMWQFVAASLPGSGMRVSDMVDERRDFWKASEAALRALQSNYTRFGDWLLALAAYNCGPNRLARIIAQTGIRDFWALREGGQLPPETARFVPKFLANTRLASYPGRHGLTADWGTAVLWDRLPLDRAVNIQLLSVATGTPLALLEQGNAELHYRVTPEGGSGYALKVPRDLRAKITTALQDPEIALMRYHVHTIRTGDTLYGLGRAFGIPADLIARHNVGIDARRLRIGTKVFIPLLGDPRPEQLLAAEAPSVPLVLTGSYTIKMGDTLWSVSQRYGVTVEDLAAGNGMGINTILRPGAVLKVPEASIWEVQRQ